MEEHNALYATFKWLFEAVFCIVKRFLIGILTTGPVPLHIAFITDGNRRYAKNLNMPTRMGHRAGHDSLKSLIKHCSELGIKYVTVYAFSIDNLKRPAEEVEALMELFKEKMEEMVEPDNFYHQIGCRVHVFGNLKLLNESVQKAAENAMKATARNDKAVLSICLAYTSTNEILHAVQESCNAANLEGKSSFENDASIDLADVEKRMYLAVAPDPDIVFRSSGETRLSNFLLWQTSNSLLYATAALWPEVGYSHLVWAILNYQRSYSYLQKKKKQV